MAGGSRGSLRGDEIAGRAGVRRFRLRVRDPRKLGGGGGTEKVGDAGSRKLMARGGQIERDGGSIVVRARRIGRGGFRINSNGHLYAPDSEEEEGQLYAPDSEEEEPNFEMEDRASSIEVAADRAPGAEVAVDEAPAEEFAPKVQARLEAVLASIDPRMIIEVW
ncbi:unnamed protein product [Urochloa humidicola]